jgi:hypothetical protein
MKPTRPELVFVISDTHCGSTLALLPPGYQTLEGNVIELNAVQKWFWQCWLEAGKWVKKVAAGSPYALVINGDLIEGNHHRTNQIISPDVGDHVAAAEMALKPWAVAADKVFIVRGTECHTGSLENALGKMLRAQKSSDGSYAWDRLLLDINGTRCVFRHHIGTSSRVALSLTQLGIQLAEEQVEAARAGDLIPKVLCCAHRHKFDHGGNHKGLVVVSPPWQALTRHGHKVVSQARTYPGVYALDFRGLPKDSIPDLKYCIFNPPTPESVCL